MNVGDIVKFKCIGAGKVDNPPYSKDGEWRIGMIVNQTKITVDMSHVLYRGIIVSALSENCHPVDEE